MVLPNAAALRPSADDTAPEVVWKSNRLHPAYATPLKTEKRVIGPAGVAAVAAAAGVPVFAIGGIERSRLPELRAAGVTRVCAIRALGAAPDPEAEARAWLRELEPARR